MSSENWHNPPIHLLLFNAKVIRYRFIHGQEQTTRILRLRCGRSWIVGSPISWNSGTRREVCDRPRGKRLHWWKSAIIAHQKTARSSPNQLDSESPETLINVFGAWSDLAIEGAYLCAEVDKGAGVEPVWAVQRWRDCIWQKLNWLLLTRSFERSILGSQRWNHASAQRSDDIMQ